MRRLMEILTRARVRAETPAGERAECRGQILTRARVRAETLWRHPYAPSAQNSNPRSRASGDVGTFAFSNSSRILTRARVRAETPGCLHRRVPESILTRARVRAETRT